MSALGFLETRGRIGAIVATDAALKSANVRLISLKRVSGGLVTVVIEGKVAAVNEAVESAKKQTCKVNCDLRATCIPRPTKETVKTLNKHTRLTKGIIRSSKK
jgi:microcompartment protein CcmL/EutN